MPAVTFAPLLNRRFEYRASKDWRPLHTYSAMAVAVCRVCLRRTPDARLRPLFARRRYERLALVADLTVTENDGLPQSICAVCMRNVCSAFKLRTLCRSSDAKFRKFLKNHPNSTHVKLESCNEISTISSRERTIENVSTDNSSSESDDIQPLRSDEFILRYESSSNRLNRSSGSVEKCSDLNQQNDSKIIHLLDDIERDVRATGSVFDTVHVFQNNRIIRTIDVSQNEGKQSNKSHNSNESDRPMRSVNNIAVCSPCSKEFNSESELREHLELVHKNEFVCDVCNKSFARKQGLIRHMKTHEENTKRTLCTFCGKAFLRSDGLKRHIRIHTGERPYSCQLCPKKYKQSSELNDHLKSHSDTKSYICSECGKGLASRNGLYNHMKIHRGEKVHKCKLCGNEFITNGELNSHIKHIHSFQKPFECTFGGCSKAFTTKLSLKIHIQAHNGEKPFKCSICERSLATSSSLLEHKKIHTGENIETCTICNKRLGNLQSLKKHMRIHSGEKPYECATCLEKFINSTTLKYHIKTNHTEEKYECTNCHEKFVFATKFRQHICLLSNEVKSYSCHICSSVFNHRSKLHHHLKIHENEKQTNEHNIRIDNIASLIPIDQISTPQSLISHYL